MSIPLSSSAPNYPARSKPEPRVPAHIPALDGIRGAAAAAVFIYHYGGGARSHSPALRVVGEVIHLGWAGVSLFFVLSGFLITGILLDGLGRGGWWKTFYFRRTLRIFPLYYASLLGGIVVLLLTGVPWSAILPAWPFFFYLQDIPGVVRFESMTPLLFVGHFWSLAVEEQFYLIWPFLLAFAGKRGQVRQLCVLVCLLSLCFRAGVFALHLNWQWAGYFIGGRAGEMAAGGFLAASLRDPDMQAGRLLRRARFVLAVSLTGTVATIYLSHQTSAGEPWFGTLGVVCLSGLFVALIALALEPGWTQRVCEFSWLRRLGRISYGVYVYHVLLLPVFAWITGKMVPGSAGVRYPLLLGVVAAAGTLVAATFSYAVIESPFLRLRNSARVRSPSATLRAGSRLRS